MPIVDHDNHPSLMRVAGEGFDVISAEQAKHQDIRELHIGFLNMMPDAAFLATERQFFRLVASATNIVQIYIHPIHCSGVSHSAEISAHIDNYYHDFDDIKSAGLDALIVTGANPKMADITQEAYWQYATQIFDWAEHHVTSVFFSCLASHAVLQAQYELLRTPLSEKLWGIYPHRVVDTKHPLVSNINTRFDMPHSRGNDVNQAQLEEKGLRVLVSSEVAGVALATSADGFRQVFCQGHPEYDTASLLREYRREIGRYMEKLRPDYPLLPSGYLHQSLQERLERFKTDLLSGKANIDDFPIDVVMQQLDNTWRDTAKAIFSNWLGLAYRVTHVDRDKLFMDGVDPKAPLASWYQHSR